MSVASLSRAAFLTLLFPRIIASGREWYSSTHKPTSATLRQQSPSQLPSDLPDSFGEIEPNQPLLQTESVQEPTKPPPPTERQYGSAFDLTFLRGSILVDAVLTGCIGFATQGWHLYLGTPPTSRSRSASS